MTQLTDYECYRQYVALKKHFSSETYNYVKYVGSIKLSHDSFIRRNDYRYFRTLALHKDPFNLLLANFSYNPNIWIGDITSEEGHRRYISWKKRQESLSYMFSEEIKNLKSSFNANFMLEPGTHPHIIKLYLAEKISLETLVILVDIARCFSTWKKKLEKDDVIWEEVSRRISKYRPFLNYDKKTYRKIVLNHFKGD